MRLGRRNPSVGRRPADPQEARAALRALEQMRELSPGGLDRLARNAMEIRYPAAADVISEGRFPSGFFIVVEGRLEVLARDGSGPYVKVNELGPGSHLGEVGLIEGMPATATVRSIEPCRLLRIPGRDLLAILDDEPRVMSAFLEPISGALARTDPTYRLAVDETAGKPTEAPGVEDLRRLAAIGGDLGPVLRPSGHDDLLDRIASAALLLLDASACSVALVENDRLVFRAVAGEGASGLKGKSLELDQGITGAVYTSGERLAVDDVAADPRFDRAFASTTGYVPGSLHAIRLETERGPLGVLQVLDAGRLADGGDMVALDAFADLAALIIETEAVFTHLGGALFTAAAEILEGTALAVTLSEVARTAPDASRPYARLLVALAALRGMDEDSAEEILRTLEGRAPG